MISIDLGSNSIRIIEFDCIKKEPIKEFSRVVKTADGLSNSGEIDIKSAQRVVDAINDSKKEINFNQKIVAVTTEAFRLANNSNEMLEYIYQHSNIKFEIISGDIEAKYTLLAVESRLDIIAPESKNFVLIDIGGGSTEIIFRYQDRVVSKSFKIGIVTISQSYSNIVEIKNILPNLMRDMKIFVDDIYFKYGKVDSFLATAGTPTTIASLKCGLDSQSYDPLVVEGTTLNKIELDKYANILSKLDYQERVKAVGSGREEIIFTGIEIYKIIFDILEFSSSTVVDFGLVEGLAIQNC